MKQVRFFHIVNGDFNYLGRVVLKDGKIRFDGLPEAIKNTLRRGLIRWKRPRKQFLPKDGLAFLKMIPETFRGSYLTARPIEDVDS